LKEKKISACFSQTKNEMIVEAVGTSETKFLKAPIKPTTDILIPFLKISSVQAA